MNVLKVLSASVLSLTMMSSVAFAGDAYSATDVEKHWAENQLYQFIDADLLSGYDNGNGEVEVRPNNSITRAEFVAILNRTLELSAGSSSGVTFSDVKKTAWYGPSVYMAVDNGLVGGVGNGKFEPNRKITRAEIANILLRAFGDSVDFNSGSSKAFGDVKDSHWAKGVINKVSRAGIIGGYEGGIFKPDAPATRAEAIVMVKRAMDKETNELPMDAELLQVIDDFFQDYGSGLAASDIKQMYMSPSITGLFQKDIAIGTFYYQLGIDAGYTHHMSLTQPLNGVVTKKTNRFAVVNMTGGEMTVEFSANGETSSEAEMVTGDYYLKKQQGNWKIYRFE